jgi:RNase H-like domain found in reverse transcriptase
MNKQKTLSTPQFKRQFYLYNDASNVGIRGNLHQPKNNAQQDLNYKNANNMFDNLEIVTIHYHLLTQTKKNYATIEKELNALVRPLEVNRHLLIGIKNPLISLTNHKNLET